MTLAVFFSATELSSGFGALYNFLAGIEVTINLKWD